MAVGTRVSFLPLPSLPTSFSSCLFYFTFPPSTISLKGIKGLPVQPCVASCCHCLLSARITGVGHHAQVCSFLFEKGAKLCLRFVVVVTITSSFGGVVSLAFNGWALSPAHRFIFLSRWLKEWGFLQKWVPGCLWLPASFTSEAKLLSQGFSGSLSWLLHLSLPWLSQRRWVMWGSQEVHWDWAELFREVDTPRARPESFTKSEQKWTISYMFLIQKEGVSSHNGT